MNPEIGTFRDEIKSRFRREKGDWMFKQINESEWK